MTQFNKKDIVFVTTTLFTESLEYQKKQLEKFFPNNEKIIIDGRKNWPFVWFEWINQCLKSDKEWFIHIDEDCFIIDDIQILNHIEFMIINGYDISGCPDGFHEYRSCNYIALNSFFMIVNRNSLIKWKEFLKLGIDYPQFNKDWLIDYPYEKRNTSTILEKQGWEKWERGSEPYYNFMWVLKHLGVKFNYLEPGYNTIVACTTLLNNSIIHCWHVREINKNQIVSSLHSTTNNERYKTIFKMLKNEEFTIN